MGTGTTEEAQQDNTYEAPCKSLHVTLGNGQKNQAQAFTTSSDPVYRLLLEGVAYILRQVWVVLTQALSRVQGTPKTWIALSFQRMIDWLVTDLGTLYPETRTIPLTTES